MLNLTCHITICYLTSCLYITDLDNRFTDMSKCRLNGLQLYEASRSDYPKHWLKSIDCFHIPLPNHKEFR